jgi:integrase
MKHTGVLIRFVDGEYSGCAFDYIASEHCSKLCENTVSFSNGYGNIDMEKRLITVRETVVEGMVGSTKNNRIRRIPFMDDLWSALNSLRKPSGSVFELDGKHVWYKTALAELRRLCKRADVQMVSWHDLRHTFASRLVERGASLLSVQKLLGHSSIQITMRCSHLGKDALRETIDLLN